MLNLKFVCAHQWLVFMVNVYGPITTCFNLWVLTAETCCA